MKRSVVALAALVVLLGGETAQAQLTIDVAKITCRQLLFDRVISTKTKSLALWLSGYYNGKRGNTVIDVAALEKNSDIVEDYCRLNQEATLREAIEKALGAK